MPRFTDQAICIRRMDWSETSQVVTLLTQQHGLVRGLAKGSKRTSPGAVARFTGGFELLTGGQALGVIKPAGELATLTEWDLQKPYHHLRQHLRAQWFGLYAADLVAAMLADHDPHPFVFHAIDRLLSQLAQPAQQEVALVQFQWSLLDDCGYSPQLDHDAVLGQSIDLDGPQASYTFDPHIGGFTRHRPTLNAPKHGPIPLRWPTRATTIRLLRALRSQPKQVNHTVSDDTVVGANHLLCQYAATILDRHLPTMAYILGRDRR